MLGGQSRNRTTDTRIFKAHTNDIRLRLAQRSRATSYTRWLARVAPALACSKRAIPAPSREHIFQHITNGEQRQQLATNAAPLPAHLPARNRDHAKTLPTIARSARTADHRRRCRLCRNACGNGIGRSPGALLEPRRGTHHRLMREMCVAFEHNDYYLRSITILSSGTEHSRQTHRLPNKNRRSPMLSRSIRELVTTRDFGRLARLLELVDATSRASVARIVMKHLPIEQSAEGKLKWIKSKQSLNTMKLASRDQELLVERILQALRGVTSVKSSQENLAVKLRRLRSEALLAVDHGQDQELTELFLKFCTLHNALINAKPKLEPTTPKRPNDYWLDESERSNSVRAISAGIPDSNRRRH
jgi:hypothetical protein